MFFFLIYHLSLFQNSEILQMFSNNLLSMNLFFYYTILFIIGYQSKCLLNWNDLPGVKVTLTKVDLSSYEQAEKLIGQGNALGGLGGIFHLDEVKLRVW